jgi:hypothetical protein
LGAFGKMETLFRQWENPLGGVKGPVRPKAFSPLLENQHEEGWERLPCVLLGVNESRLKYRELLKTALSLPHPMTRGRCSMGYAARNEVPTPRKRFVRNGQSP